MLYVIDLGQYAHLAGTAGPERLHAYDSDDLDGMNKLLRRALLGVSKTFLDNLRLVPISGTGKVAPVPFGDHFDIRFDVRVRVTRALKEKKVVREAKRCTQS